MIKFTKLYVAIVSLVTAITLTISSGTTIYAQTAQAVYRANAPQRFRDAVNVIAQLPTNTHENNEAINSIDYSAQSTISATEKSIVNNYDNTTFETKDVMDSVSIVNSSTPGQISGEQAVAIANQQIGDILNTSVHSEPEISNVEIDAPKMNKEQAEQELKTQLAIQGKTKEEINSTITELEEIGNNVASQIEQQASSMVILPDTSDQAISLAGSSISFGSDNSTLVTKINDSSVVYANANLDSDTVVKKIDSNTVETFHIIRSQDAPTAFEYIVDNLPVGSAFRQVDEKTVEAYLIDMPDQVVMTIKAPWAKDAAGKAVPISLQLSDNKIMLYVAHSNQFAYPIVADPWVSWGRNAYLNFNRAETNHLYYYSEFAYLGIGAIWKACSIAPAPFSYICYIYGAYKTAEFQWAVRQAYEQAKCFQLRIPYIALNNPGLYWYMLSSGWTSC